MFENKKFEIIRRNKISNNNINYKKLYLIKNYEIKKLKSIDDLKQNALSVSGISNILNLSGE